MNHQKEGQLEVDSLCKEETRNGSVRGRTQELKRLEYGRTEEYCWVTVIFSRNFAELS